MHNTWAIRPYDYNIAQLIREGLGVSPVTSRLLAARGIDSIEEAGRFLYDGPGQLGDPFIMKGMTKAVKRIGQAISNKEKMVIYGDYDVDGICSTVLLKECLALMGHDVDYYVPDRFSEGYGLNPRAVERLAAKGCKLLLTVDCGITSVEEVDLAQSLGMDVIVTDHHTPALVQPSAVAIVNPRNDDDRSVEHLAGVGVAYKLACALMKDIKPQRASQWLDLVALATVADIVPIKGENRILVREGLKTLANTARPGIKALLMETGLYGQNIDSWHISFVLAPRINSCGRLGSARLGIELLLCGNDKEAGAIAAQLCRLNDERRRIEEVIYQEAVQQVEASPSLLERPVLFAAQEGWHEGVIGIVASRLASTYCRPAVIISWEGGTGKGSARSFGSFDLYQALHHCADCLQRFGGHKMAAGLQLQQGNWTAFTDKLNNYCRLHYSDQQFRMLEADMELEEEEITPALLREIELLKPFGEGNPVPSFILRGNEIRSYNLVGANKNHLKLRVGNNDLDAIAFNRPDLGDNHHLSCMRDLLFEIQENNYQGKKSLQLVVRDFKPSYRSDNPRARFTPDNALTTAVNKTLQELKANRPVLFIYPGYRSFNKHRLQVRYYFRSADIHDLHPQLSAEEKPCVQEMFQKGIRGVYLTTQAYIDYYQQYFTLPAGLRYVVELWPQDNTHNEFAGCYIESIKTNRQYTFYLLQALPACGNNRMAVYANRKSTITDLYQGSKDVFIEAGINDMRSRRKVRRSFQASSAGVLVGDGACTTGCSVMEGIEGIIMADSPFGYYELDCFTENWVNNRKMAAGVYFSRHDLLKNHSYLNTMYPDENLVENIIRNLPLNREQMVVKDIMELSEVINTRLESPIKAAQLLQILRILADLGLCHLQKSGTIMKITFNKDRMANTNIGKTVHFLEGRAEKELFKAWEQDIKKCMAW